MRSSIYKTGERERRREGNRAREGRKKRKGGREGEKERKRTFVPVLRVVRQLT